MQHLVGSLDDDDHVCHWQAFGLREVSDGAVVRRQLFNSVELGKAAVSMKSSVTRPIFPHMGKKEINRQWALCHQRTKADTSIAWPNTGNPGEGQVGTKVRSL